jgi:hypothetical protein
MDSLRGSGDWDEKAIDRNPSLDVFIRRVCWASIESRAEIGARGYIKLLDPFREVQESRHTRCTCGQLKVHHLKTAI